MTMAYTGDAPCPVVSDQTITSRLNAFISTCTQCVATRQVSLNRKRVQQNENFELGTLKSVKPQLLLKHSAAEEGRVQVCMTETWCFFFLYTQERFVATLPKSSSGFWLVDKILAQDV